MTRLRDEKKSIFQQLPTLVSTWKLNPVRERAEVKTLFLSEGDYLLGSGADCDVVVDVPGVASHHCRLIVEQGRLSIESMDSHTWINDGVVQKARVRSGDRLTVGPVTFLLLDCHDEKFAESREWKGDPDLPVRNESGAGWLEQVAEREKKKSGIQDLNPDTAGIQTTSSEDVLEELHHSLLQSQSQLADQKEQLLQLMSEKNKMVEQAEKQLSEVEPLLSSSGANPGKEQDSGAVFQAGPVSLTQGLFTSAVQQRRPDQSVYYRNQLERLLQVQKKWRQQFLKKQSELGLAETRLQEKGENFRQQEQSLLEMQDELRQQRQALSQREQELNRNQLALVASQQEWDARERGWEEKYQQVIQKVQAADLLLEQGRASELELQEKLGSLYEQLTEQSLRVQELELLEPELEKQQRECLLKEETISGLQQKLETLKSDLEEREEQLQKSQQSHETLAGENQRLEQAFEEREFQLSQIQESLNIRLDELAGVQAEKADLQQELTSVREELERFLAETQQELISASAMKEELQGEMLELQILVDERELEKKTLEEELQAFQQQLKSVTEELALWQERTVEETRQKEKFQEECQKLQEEILNVRQETSGQLEESLQQVATRELELQVSKEQFEFQIAEADALQSEKEALQQLLSAQAEQLAGLEAELVSLRESSRLDQASQAETLPGFQAEGNGNRESESRDLEEKYQEIFQREEELNRFKQKMELERAEFESRLHEFEQKRGEVREKEEELAAEQIRLGLREEKIREQEELLQASLFSQRNESEDESFQLTQESREVSEHDMKVLEEEHTISPFFDDQDWQDSVEEEMVFSLSDLPDVSTQVDSEGQVDSEVISEEAELSGISSEQQADWEQADQTDLEEEILQETEELLGELGRVLQSKESSDEEASQPESVLDEVVLNQDVVEDQATGVELAEFETEFEDAAEKNSSERSSELLELTSELPEDNSQDDLARIRKELASMFGMTQRAGDSVEEEIEEAGEEKTKQASLFHSLEQASLSVGPWEDEERDSVESEPFVTETGGLKSLLSAELWGKSSSEEEVDQKSEREAGVFGSGQETSKKVRETDVVVEDIEDAESVAAYMERLFARTGGRQNSASVPVSEPVSRASAKGMTHKFSGEDDVSEAGLSETKPFTQAAFKSEPRESLRPISQQDRDLIKKEIESLRDVANQTARNALATHAWKQVRLKMMASGLLTLVSGLTAAVLISSPWWSPISYENYGWLTLLLTLLSGSELFRSRLQLIQLKQNRKQVAGSGSVGNDSLETKIEEKKSPEKIEVQ